MMLKRVDFPQPEGPITERNSPGTTSKETWSTATSPPSCVSKRLKISSTTRIGSIAFSTGTIIGRMAEIAAIGLLAGRPISTAAVGLVATRHGRGGCGAVARKNARIDHRAPAVLDYGDRFLERLFEF